MTKFRNMLKAAARFICLILYLLFFISTIISDNFFVGNLKEKYLIAVMGLLVMSMLYLTFRYRSSKFILKLKLLLHNKMIVFFVAILLISIQVTVALKLKASLGFDAGGIMDQATYSRLNSDGQSYFSRYPNNLLLYFLEKIVFLLAGSPASSVFLTSLVILNIIILDLAVVVSYLILQVFKPTNFQMILFWFLSLFFLLLTPWMIVFYSDTLVMLPNSILCYLLLTYFKHDDTKWYLFRGLEISITLWIAYHLKPTSIIIFLAGLIVFVLFARLNKKKLLVVALSGVIMTISFFAFQQGFNQFVDHQKIVQLDDNARFTAAQFMMMGLQGNGGYSKVDVINSIEQPTVNKRTKYNIKVIHQRFQQFGVRGYAKFLIKKMYYSTADGTLGWGKEGRFLVDDHPQQHKFIKSLIYPNGQRQVYYRVFSQIIWVIVSFGVLLTLLIKEPKILLLQLSFAGLLMFLMLFEAGRSRYLIQFLPIILILANIGYSKLVSHFSHKRQRLVKE